MNPSIFQHARFKPAPDQTDQGWIADSIRDEPEDPIMIESLQHPPNLAAGDDLIKGRQGMMRPSPVTRWALSNERPLIE
jgi:hypothetical protein